MILMNLLEKQATNLDSPANKYVYETRNWKILTDIKGEEGEVELQSNGTNYVGDSLSIDTAIATFQYLKDLYF
jgi:hypothetical protein